MAEAFESMDCSSRSIGTASRDKIPDQLTLFSMARDDGNRKPDPARVNDSNITEGDLESRNPVPQLTTGTGTASTVSTDDIKPSTDEEYDKSEMPLIRNASEIGTLDGVGSGRNNVEMSKSLVDRVTMMLDDIDPDIGGGEPRQLLKDKLQGIEQNLPPEQATFPRPADKSNLDSVQDSHVACSECASNEASEPGAEESPEILCMTENFNDPSSSAIRVGLHGRIIPRWTPGSPITYAEGIVSHEGLEIPPKDKLYAIASFEKAVTAWNLKDIGVTFKRVKRYEPHILDLAYGKFFDKGLLALAFFPNAEPISRVLYVYESAFGSEFRKYLPGILSHELGHVLGLRHEFAGRKERHNPSVLIGPENGDSIMNYFFDNGPEKWQIHDLDVKGVKELYQLDSKNAYRGYRILDVSPQGLKECPRHGIAPKDPVPFRLGSTRTW